MQRIFIPAYTLFFRARAKTPEQYFYRFPKESSIEKYKLAVATEVGINNINDYRERYFNKKVFRSALLVLVYAFAIYLSVVYKKTEDRIVTLKEQKEEFEARLEKLKNMNERFDYMNKMKAMIMTKDDYNGCENDQIKNEENDNLREKWEKIQEEVQFKSELKLDKKEEKQGDEEAGNDLSIE